MKAKAIIAFIICSFASLCISAQTASAPQRTLRIDYQFAGNAQKQEIAVSELSSFSGWAGRTVHTDSVPLRGNGEIRLCDARTHSVLYRQTFSTLFQEWLTTEEATQTSRSFENVFLLPMPSDSAYVTISLFADKAGAKDVTLTLEPQAVVVADRPAEETDAKTGKPVETRPAWSRRLELPFRVNADKANAKFENGILRIELPKAEADGVRHIAIQG